MNTVCPKCFTGSDQADYACQTPGCARSGAPIPAAQAVPREQGGPLCPGCQKPLQKQLCPACGYPLPATEGERAAMPFVLAGASGSGKSNFLSVLLNQIGGVMGKTYGCSLYPLGGDATMDSYARLYYHPLFVQGQVPASTETEDVEPLRYSLVFSQGKNTGRTCHFSLYDSCGATFESEETTSRHNRSLLRSRGIFLLLDPSQLPELRDQLRSQGKTVLDSDPGALLTRIIRLLREETGRHNLQQRLSVPIAVCLSKLDQVWGLLDRSSFLTSSSRHLRQPALDTAELDCCSLEVQSLLDSWGCGELVSQVQAQFANHAFFAFTSLGGEPTGGSLSHRVSPHRVLDPFLWMLWKHKVIGGN